MNARWRRALLAAAVLSMGLAGPRGVTAGRRPSLFQQAQETQPRELLVRFQDNCSPAQRAAVLRRVGLMRERTACRGTIEVVHTLGGQSMAQVVKMLSETPGVSFAEANDVAYALGAPNDPLYSYQWHLQDTGFGLHAPAAWAKSRGAGAVVAVVDTGIAYVDRGANRLAPDLAQTDFVAGYDFVNDDPIACDDNGHGTHVAGVIAQSTGNNLGCAGVAPEAALMPIKVLDAQGVGKYEWIAEGVRFAADNGADVINLSLGGATTSATVQDAIRYAYSKGAIVLAAAGNTGAKGVAFPASLPEVIAVGSIRFDGTRAYYSNYGPEIDLVAPGGDPRVDQNKDGYEDGILQQTLADTVGTFRYSLMSGTSFAVANVSGVAALLRSFRPNWTPAQIREALEKSAMDVGPRGRDEETGYGVVNAEAALNYAAAVTPAPVEPAPPPPTTTAPPATPKPPAATPPTSTPPTSTPPAPANPTPTTPAPANPAPKTPSPVVTPTPGGAPLTIHDVQVTDVEVPATVRRDTMMRVTVTVANAGTEDEAVAVGLLDQTAGSWPRNGVVTLKPGQSARVDFQWNAGTLLGKHTLMAYAVLPGGATDDKPANNQQTETFEVQKGLLTLTLTPSKAPFRAGDLLEFTAQVRSATGPVPGVMVNVAIYAPLGYRLFSRTVYTNADGNAVVSLSRYNSRYGLGTLRAEVNVAREGYEPLFYKTTYELTN